jgi:hypothetical protein
MVSVPSFDPAMLTPQPIKPQLTIDVMSVPLSDQMLCTHPSRILVQTNPPQPLRQQKFIGAIRRFFHRSARRPFPYIISQSSTMLVLNVHILEPSGELILLFLLFGRRVSSLSTSAG